MTAADFSDLTALFVNTALTRSPGESHTQLLIDVSASIMARQGVRVDQFRAVDHPIATGVYPDMRDHGWEVDAWPDLFLRVMAADILVTASSTARPTCSTASSTSATAWRRSRTPGGSGKPVRGRATAIVVTTNPEYRS